MTATETPSTKVVGTRMLRREDPALLTGEAKYTNDLNIPGALHLAVVRSPHAHARITSIDTSAAAALPGIVAVYTGADLAPVWGAPMPCAWPVTTDMKNPPHFPLAKDKVCFAGDGVAGGDRPRGGRIRPGDHPRRPRHQRQLQVGPQGRRQRGCRRRGLRRRGVHRQ